MVHAGTSLLCLNLLSMVHAGTSLLCLNLLSMVHAGTSLLCLNRADLNAYLNRMGPHGDRSVVQMEDNIKMLTQCN